MNLSKTKLRRASVRALSVTLSTTTTLWLVGSSMFLAVPAVHASNDAVVSDITGTNPRIAPNGESELAVLGVNIQMDVNSNGVDKRLQSVVVQLKSDDAAGNGEAALSNLETARLYTDSGLSGTGGQFDSNDALVATASRAGAANATALVNNVAGYPAATTSIDIDTLGAGWAAACVDDDDSTTATNPCTVKLGSGLTSEVRIASAENDDAAAGDACATGVGANTCLLLDVATTFAHPDNEALRQVANQIANAAISNSVASGFSTFAAAGTGALRTGQEEAVVFGDTTADADADILTFTPPTTDTGNDAGNDLFVTLLTQGGVANQTFIASIWPDENAGENVRIQLHDILLGNAGEGGQIAVNSNTTNNESKTVTMGSDNVAPTILSVKHYDNDGDGNVDRVRVLFSESMANTVTATSNFVTTIGDVAAGNRSAIASVPASNDDADLAANGTWQTTTLLNDTLQIDFQGDNQSANCAVAEPDPVGTYCNATASTGDTFSVVYDQGNAGVAGDDLTDATGTVLADQTISTTDASRPVILVAQVRDNDGDSKVDELRLTGSETWGGSSTSSGLELKRTDVNPNVTYTLGSVSGFLQSAGAAPVNGNANTSNSNDIIRIAVTEQTDADVTGVFQVNYTAASTLSDAAGNEARSITGLAAGSAAAPVVSQAWITDMDNVAGGAPVPDGMADNDGQIDALVVIFNQNVDVDEDGAGNLATQDMALSGGYAFAAAAPLDEDNDVLLIFPIVQSGVSDTDQTPDWTYTNDGAADGESICSIGAGHVGNACTGGGGGGANDVLLDSVLSSSVTEQNRAGAVLLSATLYENSSTADDIWQTGETLVFVFSEPVDSSSFRTSYANDGFFNGPSDFGWAVGNGANAMPDSVSVSASGRVVTATANSSATATLAGADTVMPGVHEILDTQGNFSPDPNTGAGVVPGFGVAEQGFQAAVALTVTPAAAPAVLRISTNDENNNGVLDSFIVELAGLVDPATVMATDFAAARGANFNADILGVAAPCGGVAGDNFACATQDVVPDLTITSAATMNGSNDSRIIVRYTEAGENTGARPQLKYVQGSLADLAANKIAAFNVAASDNTKVDLNITNGAGDIPARDGVAPKVMYKYLRDRNANNMIDQLVIVYSETVLNGAGTIANGVLTSAGWSVAGKTVAANGVTINNTDFQQFTFATVSNVWTVDVTEGTSQDATIPSTSYTSSGNVRDTGGNVLGDVAVGGEATNITNATPAVADGDLVKGSGPAVYVVKKVGSKTFKRHVLTDTMDQWYGHLAPFWSHVKTITDGELAAMTLSAWVRMDGAPAVYEVNDDRSAHHITCDDDNPGHGDQNCTNEWVAVGGDPDGVYVINAAEMAYYSVANPVVLPDIAD